MKYAISITLAAALFAAGAYVGYLGNAPEFAIERIERDTVVVERSLIDTMIEPRYYAVAETVAVAPDLDSLWSDALDYWDSVAAADSISRVGAYVAEFDTLSPDSAFRVSARYESRLPLDPAGRFSTEVSVRDRVVLERVFADRESSFWNRFGVGFTAGVGATFEGSSARIAPFVGVGAFFRIQ
jgi:hypothetical protein